MSLITRQFGPNAKGSKLTFQEMDDNLLYLEGLSDGISYYGQMSIQTGTTVSIATASTYQSLGFSGTLDSQVFGLTSATDFGLKNISGNTILLEVYASVDLDNGNNKVYGIKLAKNGVLIDETECRAETGNTHTLIKLNTNWMIELDDQDEVELYLTNFTSTGNVVVDRAKVVANTVGKTDVVSSGTQSFTFGFPLFSDLFDYALNISGTYSDFTYAKTATFSSIVNSQDFNSGTVSNVIGPTTSVYNGLLTTNLTGGTNLVDVIAANITVVEGPVPSDDVAYQYFFHLNTVDLEYHYEFIEMATHSSIRYAHYFNITNITGRSGGAIELDFDGVTVTTQFGSNSLFSTNVP
jgi:hypothetical protein